MQNNLSHTVNVELNKDETKHEASLLKLDISKAKNKLNWESRWGFQETIKHTANWYEHYYKKGDIFNFSLSQVNQYLSN